MAVKLETHLFIDQCELMPGAEWPGSSTPGWKIVLVSKGFFYWIAQSEVRDLKTGDMLVIGPATSGVLLASKICAAGLHYFHFHPEQLVGLLSISDRLSLEAFTQSAPPRIFSAEDLVAREFAALLKQTGQRRNFSVRCRLLHLVGMIFGDLRPDENGAAAAPRISVSNTLARFEEIISRVSDTDLVHLSSEKLAEMCGCSVRHFRRMFREHFKTSIRARQTELRLEKARQLLLMTEDKMAVVAREAGYHHLGFFNLMFKKKFGMTPSEWRRSAAARTDGEADSLVRRSDPA